MRKLSVIFLVILIAWASLAQDLAVKVHVDGLNGKVPLALAHLYGQKLKEPFAKMGSYEMVAVELENKSSQARTLQLKLDLPGLGAETIQTVQIGSLAKTVVRGSPIIDSKLIGDYTDERIGKLKIEVMDGQTVVYSDVVNVTLVGKDDIPMYHDSKPLYFFLVTRVQPKSRVVNQVLAEAAKRMGLKFHPGITGYQGNNDPTQMQEDIRKIYKTIQAMGFTYVNTPTSFEDDFQRIKNPSEALKNRNGNCIDGTLVFASCISAIGYDPLIVLVPGHAFVIATISAANMNETRASRMKMHNVTTLNGQPALPNNLYASWVPIETTVLQGRSNGNAGLTRTTFEEAMKIASGELQKLISSGQLNSIFLVDVEAWRACGFLPAPDDQ